MSKRPKPVTVPRPLLAGIAGLPVALLTVYTFLGVAEAVRPSCGWLGVICVFRQAGIAAVFVCLGSSYLLLRLLRVRQPLSTSAVGASLTAIGFLSAGSSFWNDWAVPLGVKLTVAAAWVMLIYGASNHFLTRPSTGRP
jgi:hypothetical protein